MTRRYPMLVAVLLVASLLPAASFAAVDMFLSVPGYEGGCTEPGFEEPGHAFETTPKVAGIPIGLPLDMPKAWFVALAALSKSATPARVRENAQADHLLRAPSVKLNKKR